MKRKILVVDDEPDFIRLVKMRLENEGYQAIVACNGKEALKLYKTEKPDAILLDVMMPGIDGLQVLKEIRSVDPDIPIFMVTAFSNEERIRLAANLNATSFIIKGDSDMTSEIKNISSIINVVSRPKGKNGR